MRAALYTRVSSQEQVQHGVSLAEQKERLEAWAKMEGWEIADIYTDEGYTGGNDNRPDLQRLMADAKAGAFTHVAVTKIDRFFRNTRQLLNYIHELETSGVTFVAQAEGIDTSRPGMGKVILSMLGSVAEWERERIGNRVSDFRRHLAGKGRWSSGRTPFGYRFNKETKELIVDPLEAEAIKFIFQTYTEKQIGIVRVAELCNQRGLLTPRAGRRKHTTWTQSAVRHVLTHPSYKGGPNSAWQFNTPAIVTPEIWQQAQHQLASNRHFRAAETHNPFSGLLRCGLCGHTLRIGYSHSTKPMWECPGRLKRLHLDGSPRCTLPRREATSFETLLATEVVDVFSDEGKLRHYVEETIKNLHKEHDLLERKLRPIQSSIKHIQQQMEKADTMYDLGRLSREDYRSRIIGLRKRLAETEKQTNEADPLLLRQLDGNEALIRYYEQQFPARLQDYEKMVAQFQKLALGKKWDISGDRLKNWMAAGYLEQVFNLPSEAFDSEGNIVGYTLTPDPTDAIARYLRNFGLYVYIYPRKLEIKGAVRQTYVTSACREDINLPLCISIPMREAGRG